MATLRALCVSDFQNALALSAAAPNPVFLLVKKGLVRLVLNSSSGFDPKPLLIRYADIDK